MIEEIKRTSTAMENAQRAGDGYAAGRLSSRLARLVSEYRNALLLELEARYEQLQAATERRDWSEVNRLFPSFERTLHKYERLCDRIREHPDVSADLADVGVPDRREPAVR